MKSSKAMIRHILLAFLFSATASLVAPSQAALADEPAAGKRPNIVLILADDLGYTDLAPYGSEIDTPNISALAEGGVMFTNYHTAASCAPTRAMLLTGVDSHRNGVPNIPEAIPPEQGQYENYQGTLSPKVETLATMLKRAGYHTYMTGKWHLGHEDPALLPFNRGFERTITMPFTGADNWEQRAYIPVYPEPLWFADGKPYTLPEDFYSSRHFIDKTIEFIDSNIADGRPFFSYIPFQAVHIPVQAPLEFTEKYADQYKEGWDALRKDRQAAAKDLGLVAEESELFSMPGHTPWDSLTPEEKIFHARSMAVYAGMIDAMDMHIGRLVTHLKEIGEFENTIFIITSDNGAEANDPFGPGSERFRQWLERVGYRTDVETLGTKGSFNAIGPNFASAAVGPLAWYKFYVGEGGTRVPLIISGAPLENLGPEAPRMSDSFVWVTDLTPTILSFAGLAKAGEKLHSGSEDMTGRSLLPLLSGETSRLHPEDHVTGFELGGNKALYQGDYKITYNRPPLGDSTWHLFNLRTDPGEARDLAAEEPERLAAMIALYEDYALTNNVQPVPEGYSQVEQVFKSTIAKRVQALILRALLAFVLGLAILVGFIWWRRSRKSA